MSTINLNIPHQSGYKNHIVRKASSSENKATIIMLLDLSAAFDTVDHSQLLNILKHEIGITGIAFEWFKSYISGGCQKVRIGNHESDEIIIKLGVPQEQYCQKAEVCHFCLFFLNLHYCQSKLRLNL